MMVISAQAMDPSGIGTTGKFLVLYDDDIDVKGMMGALRDVAGITAAAASDFVAAVPTDDQSVVIDSLGVAIVSADRDQFSALRQSTRDGPARGQVAMEPDRIVHAISDDYVRGYRDGVQDMSNRLLGAEQSDPTLRMQETDGTTWGLQAIGIGQAPGLGKDISVAVLDTGIDRDHPDLAGRVKADQSFIKDEVVQDANGHGTHCAGTVAGPVNPATGPRYGVAPETSLLVGKVLSNAGRGSDGSVLQGINWAMEAGAHIVSMSLGAFVPRGATYSRVYERAARRALNRNMLVVAAAGNDSSRPQTIEPVNSPANTPSVMAVAAVDQNSQIASFSNGGINQDGGQIDIAGPGVAIRSAWLGGTYKSISGTSMATPHVAGVAAVLAGSDPSLRGTALWHALMVRSRRLVLPSRDVGSGMVFFG